MELREGDGRAISAALCFALPLTRALMHSPSQTLPQTLHDVGAVCGAELREEMTAHTVGDEETREMSPKLQTQLLEQPNENIKISHNTRMSCTNINVKMWSM